MREECQRLEQQHEAAQQQLAALHAMLDSERDAAAADASAQLADAEARLSAEAAEQVRSMGQHLHACPGATVARLGRQNVRVCGDVSVRPSRDQARACAGAAGCVAGPV